MGHNFPPIPPSRTSWDEFARWYVILTDPAAVAQAYIDYPALLTAEGLQISPEAAATLFSAPLEGSPPPNFYPATLLHWAAPIVGVGSVTLATMTDVASGNLTANDAGGGGPITLPFTWGGTVLLGGIDATPVPPDVPVCLQGDYACYSRMGRGDTYTPAINQADASLHDVAAGGYRTDSWIELGIGGAAAIAIIEPFDGTPLDIGDSGITENGIAFGIQFALKVTGTLPGTFTLLWDLTGTGLSVQLFAREVAGVNEFEWRGSGAGGSVVLTATPKAALAIDDWIVLGLLYEAYHLICNVASADCDAAPFGTQDATAVRLTDLGSLATASSSSMSGTGTLDDMTFYAASTTIGWACTVFGFIRTGIVLSEITVPASCLDFLGFSCPPALVGTCVAFDPSRCLECYSTDQGVPLRIKFGPNPTVTITPDPTTDQVIVFDDLLGVEATLAEADGLPFDPTFRLSPTIGSDAQQDPDAPEIELSTNPLAIPLTLSGTGLAVDVPPTCPGSGDTGAARDDGIPYIP